MHETKKLGQTWGSRLAMPSGWLTEEAEGGSGIKIVSPVASKQAHCTHSCTFCCFTVLGEIRFLGWVSDTITSLRVLSFGGAIHQKPEGVSGHYIGGGADSVSRRPFTV